MSSGLRSGGKALRATLCAQGAHLHAMRGSRLAGSRSLTFGDRERGGHARAAEVEGSSDRAFFGDMNRMALDALERKLHGSGVDEVAERGRLNVILDEVAGSELQASVQEALSLQLMLWKHADDAVLEQGRTSLQRPPTASELLSKPLEENPQELRGVWAKILAGNHEVTPIACKRLFRTATDYAEKSGGVPVALSMLREGKSTGLLPQEQRSSALATVLTYLAEQEEAHDYSPTKFKFFLWNDRALNRLLMVESVMHEMQPQDASGRPDVLAAVGRVYFAGLPTRRLAATRADRARRLSLLFTGGTLLLLVMVSMPKSFLIIREMPWATPPSESV